MERLFVFIIRNDIWILILSALALFWYTSQFIRAQRGLRSAVFGLERERGLQRRSSALFFMGLFAAIIGVVIFVNRQIAPTIPAELLKPPTPTPDFRRTPLSPPTPLGSRLATREIITPDLAPTVTLIGSTGGEESDAAETPGFAEATATPYVPPTPFVGCNVDLNLSEPRDGAAVGSTITFAGTADTENFGAYILETNGPQTSGQWASLLGREVDQPVREGFLGSANLSMWASGPYLIRLTALDSAGNITGTCVIQVTLSGNS